jgi:HEAT repeat protein
MRRYSLQLLAVAILLTQAALSSAESAGLAQLTAELTGEKPAAARTPAQLAAAYAEVLGALLPDLGNEDTARRAGPQTTLEKIAFRASRPGLEADRATCAQTIAAQLAADVGPLGRVWLLRQLERIGRAEAVPQVVRLLADADGLVRESARRALQKNPAHEANAALLAALESAGSPTWRVPLINALGERRDPSNLKPLLHEAAAEDDALRTAAVVALAKLGDKSAAGAIAAAMHRGTPAARRTAADAFLRLTEALLAKGDKAAALANYRTLLTASERLWCAALIGLGRAGTADDLPTIFAALADPDARGACVEALCLLPGQAVTAAVAARARTATPGAKPALLQALARRGAKNSLPIFIAAASEPDENVRVAALEGLGRLGDATAVGLLLKSAAAGTLQETARQSLQSLPGAAVDKALIDAMREPDPQVRVEVVRALASRQVVAATPALLRAAGDSDNVVRRESLKALGAVAASDVLPALAGVLSQAHDDESRGEAAIALSNIANREQDVEARSEPILEALRSSRGRAKLALLGVLGRIGGQTSLVCLRTALGDDDPKIRDAALRALCEWPDATAAGDLLALARSADSQTHQVLAVRGYIRVCRIRADRPASETARLLVAGLAAARRPDEKRQALGGLAEVSEILALDAVVPCLDDAALKEEAASAALRIGRGIWSRYPQAVKSAMRRAIEVSRNERLKQDAQEILASAEHRLAEMKAKK